MASSIRYLEAYRHVHSHKVFYPLKSFEVPEHNGITSYITVIFAYKDSNGSNRRTFSLEHLPTDVIASGFMLDNCASVYTNEELLGKLDVFGNIYLERLKEDASYTQQKQQAFHEGISHLLIKVIDDKASTRLEKINLLKGFSRMYTPLYHSYDIQESITKSYLNDLLEEEADHRYYAKNANRIKKQFTLAITNPHYMLCQNRLKREYLEMGGELHMG
jgi:DNA-binding TFAR19-related protein (PDSD5 family)